MTETASDRDTLRQLRSELESQSFGEQLEENNLFRYYIDQSTPVISHDNEYLAAHINDLGTGQVQEIHIFGINNGVHHIVRAQEKKYGFFDQLDSHPALPLFLVGIEKRFIQVYNFQGELEMTIPIDYEIENVKFSSGGEFIAALSQNREPRSLGYIAYIYNMKGELIDKLEGLRDWKGKDRFDVLSDGTIVLAKRSDLILKKSMRKRISNKEFYLYPLEQLDELQRILKQRFPNLPASN